MICCFSEARWALLVRAVRSAFTQTLAPQEVIVVVDHSPGLLRRVRNELSQLVAPDDRHLMIVPNSGLAGLADARNTGVRSARAEVVAFLDDDAAASPDWLMRLSEQYRDPAVVAVGGRVVAEWEGGRPGWWPSEFDWVVGCAYRGLPEARAHVRNLIGANMSFRRDALVETGGFSTNLGRVGTRPVGCEETELCIRLANRNGEQSIVYEPDATVRHHVPGSRANWAYFRSRCYGEGLSKAKVRSLAGARSALSSERTYLLETIPNGIAVGLGRGLRGRPGGARAGAMVLGVLVTVVGYVMGRFAEGRPDVAVLTSKAAILRAGSGREGTSHS